ncbi:hypothetical protein CEV08_06485 [Bartonella tribocorum]|uniref:Uncharacterized protein n=1 Tax=Bartonella tribocorum TaxID=85701 RepID=A0A2M6USV3_9HYPH|nr:hypothetical protein CEV08_06485 [Bartonella tribocorum]
MLIFVRFLLIFIDYTFKFCGLYSHLYQPIHILFVFFFKMFPWVFWVNTYLFRKDRGNFRATIIKIKVCFIVFLGVFFLFANDKC